MVFCKCTSAKSRTQCKLLFFRKQAFFLKKINNINFNFGFVADSQLAIHMGPILLGGSDLQREFDLKIEPNLIVYADFYEDSSCKWNDFVSKGVQANHMNPFVSASVDATHAL